MFFRQMYSGGGSFTLTISANTANPNIPVLAAAAGWNGSGFLKVLITASLINRIALLSSWSFPSGIEIEISASTRVGGNKAVSGVAFTTQIPVSVRNLGIISGIGGSGGTGGTTFFTYASGYYNASGGGGGAGQGFSDATGFTITGPVSGEAGGYYEYPGPVFGGDTRPYCYGGNGGTGGFWGQAGADGGFGTLGGSYDSSGSDPFPTNGGLPGNSVVGNSFITWLATGTRLGPIS